MPAVLFLALCLTGGLGLLRLFFRPLLTPCFTSLRGEEVPVFLPYLALPASFCLGFIGLVWAAYGAAYLARGTGRAMAFGAGAAFLAGALLALAGWKKGPPLFASAQKARFGKRVWRAGAARGPQPAFSFWRGPFGGPEIFALLFALSAGLFVSFYSFWEDASSVSIAVNVYSDFSPHIAVIRSFSEGSNFPTQYPHFADGTIRYHFLFLFGAGLLEYLGLPLTWALNLPSLLSFLSLALLLFTLARVLTASRGAAALSLPLFFFRSSFAFFTFLARRPEGSGLWEWLLANKTFIGSTTHEDWGLFNQNVWANQRHLALGVCFVLLAILYFLPLFTGGWEHPAGQKGLGAPAFFNVFLMQKEGWLPDRARLWGLPMGVLLGASAFWHGSMVISALMILAGLGLFSRGRLTYLFTALPTVLLSSLQSAFFTGGASPLDLQVKIGFLAASGSLRDIAGYLLLLTGIFFPLYAAGLIWAGGRRPAPGLPLGRGPAIVFFLCVLLPLLQAFTLQMTPDLAVAHKQVMLSLLLGGILPAWLLTALWKKRRAWAGRAAAVFLLFLLTVTGLEDAVTYGNLCRSAPVKIDKQDPLTDWIRQETAPGSVFLTGYITIHPVFTAGRLAYQGWPYYAWSAGYDTSGRDETLKALFSGSDPRAFAAAARATGADYLLVDDSLTSDSRFSAFFEAGGGSVIAAALPLVYEDGKARVYRVPLAPASS